jgi:NAD(P)-dependent dehydrogenase (short-subunit alcohol dehydrogenase family)
MPPDSEDAILGIDDRDWHDQIDVNLTGTANVLRVFAPLLVRRGGGRIRITLSTQGEHGTKSGSSYSASKWGLIGLMKSAALELGSYGITVNAVIPGLIDTALTRPEDRYTQAISSGGQEPAGDLSRGRRDREETPGRQEPTRSPLDRPGGRRAVVAFLASDEARMVSGASFAVTAGDSANITAWPIPAVTRGPVVSQGTNRPECVAPAPFGP